jgi:hypothetical protein
MAGVFEGRRKSCERESHLLRYGVEPTKTYALSDLHKCYVCVPRGGMRNHSARDDESARSASRRWQHEGLTDNGGTFQRLFGHHAIRV